MNKSSTRKFRQWNEWEHELFDAVQDFYSENLSFPNILMANQHTFSQIDYISNINPEKRENIILVIDDETIDTLHSSIDSDYKQLKGIQVSKDCSLDFAEDNSLKDAEYILVKDDNPNWGDGDVEVPPEPQEEKVAVKR